MSKSVDEIFLTNIKIYCNIRQKKEVQRIKKITTQDWINIKEIFNNGIIKTKDNKFIKILKVIPINYNLKSDLEKMSILNSYKIFLKTCNFNIQILIQSNKEDLSKHILKIQKNIQKRENRYLKEFSENYIEYINTMNLTQKSSSKNFYIVISKKIDKKEIKKENIEIVKSELQENYFKLKDCLARCGNIVLEISDRKEIIKIFYSFFNTRKYKNSKVELQEKE